VVFDGQPPIAMADTISYDPPACNGLEPFSRYGLRLGYNYFPSIEGFDPSFVFDQNFTLGAFITFGFNYNARLNYHFEANYNRRAFKQSGLILQQENYEILPMVRLLLGRKLALGLGPSVLFDVNWTLDGNEANIPFVFDQTQIGGVLDLSYNNLYRGISAGLRGQYYPNSLNFSGKEKNRLGFQLYAEVPLYYRTNP
jgi:hypothetical protein